MNFINKLKKINSISKIIFYYEGANLPGIKKNPKRQPASKTDSGNYSIYKTKKVFS